VIAIHLADARERAESVVIASPIVVIAILLADARERARRTS
jgi:hypothetical protein